VNAVKDIPEQQTLEMGLEETGGVASLNHRLIAATPPGSILVNNCSAHVLFLLLLRLFLLGFGVRRQGRLDQRAVRAVVNPDDPVLAAACHHRSIGTC